MNVHGCNNGISSIHGKNYQNNCHSIVNTTDLTLKQMLDISTKLVSEQDEISRLETIGWENHSWKYLSLIGAEKYVTVMSTVSSWTTVQQHYTGSKSTPPRVARLCQIREASLVALRKISKIFECSHVSIVRLVQSFILVSRELSFVATVPFAR